MIHQHQTIVLTPSPIAFLRSYTIGILLIPLFIGLYLLWRTEIKRRSLSYTINENMLTIVDGKFSQNIDLNNINDVKIRHDQFGVANVIVNTSTLSYSLIGLKEPEKIAGIIKETE